MTKRIVLFISLLWLTDASRVFTASGANQGGIRPLVPEEIWPNLNFYTLDPLYQPGIPLGWATERIEERLNRGVVAVPIEGGKVYLGWRMLRSDPQGIAFNVYRVTAGGAAVKLNALPVTQTTDIVDDKAPLDKANAWFVRPMVNGQEQAASERAELQANPSVQQYKAISLKDDVRGVSMVGIGDLDGDGMYDFVVKHPGGGKDPGRTGPNRGAYKYDGYNGKTGQFMWRIDLGWNVDMGIWWTPMVVRDLDGDNKAEVCVRTSSYAATQEEMLASGKTGFLLDAPEFLVVYDGATGQEIDRAAWIELGKVQDWGDNTGNRASRHMMGVAYLDGKTPSVLAIRGQYGLMKVDAWMLKDKKLVKVWRWTNERAGFTYQAAGQHSIKTADIDADGCDEILNGAIAIDHDGKTLWSTGYGHGDRFYLGDIDPDRPGLEVWMAYEDPHPRNGASLWDTTTGGLIFGIPVPSGDNELGQALAGDIDPNYPGMEVAAGRHYYTSKGVKINEPAPPKDFLVWWDADLLREVYTRGTISKWKGPNLMTIPRSALQIADLCGDWREEVVVAAGSELRIYTTVIPAVDRRVCLMQDPLYRNDVTHRTVGYPHTPMTSFYLGTSQVETGRSGPLDLAAYELHPVYENDFSQAQRIAREEDFITRSDDGSWRRRGRPDPEAEWIAEGWGGVEIRDARLYISPSIFDETGRPKAVEPGQRSHMVVWNRRVFPADFLLEFEFSPCGSTRGLAMVLICATAKDGRDIFDPALPPRRAEYKSYHSGELANYTDSFWSRNTETEGLTSRLRRNPGFTLVAEGPSLTTGPTDRTHRLRILKCGPHVEAEVNGRVVLRWDDPETPLGAGHIGLRSMEGVTKVALDNVKVWQLERKQVRTE